MPDPVIADPVAPVESPGAGPALPLTDAPNTSAASTDAAVAGADAPVATAPGTTSAKNPRTPKELPQENPEDKVARLEAEVKKVRDEAAKARIDRREQEHESDELIQQIRGVLGLVPDETADPAKLLEQTAAAKAQARQAEMELAVYRAADPANADPAALLDSRTFLAKVAEIDPSDSAALEAAIAVEVTLNPRRFSRSSAGAPTGMKPNPAQGASASPPLGVDAQIRVAEQALRPRVVQDAAGNTVQTAPTKADLQAALRLKSAKLNQLANKT